MIEITDNGHGISPEVLEHVFDPYYTTKSDGAAKGTGLGLFICNKIIKDHDGKIEVESKPLVGTETTIILPLHSDSC